MYCPLVSTFMAVGGRFRHRHSTAQPVCSRFRMGVGSLEAQRFAPYGRFRVSQGFLDMVAKAGIVPSGENCVSRLRT